MAHCRRGRKQTQRRDYEYDDEPALKHDFVKEVMPIFAKPLVAKTINQRKYINAIQNFKLVFGVGPAGTGKTYIAASIACDMLKAGVIDSIIITRPAVEAGEKLGALPGELEDKYGPYIAPFRDILDERLGKSFVDNLIKLDRIKAEPFAYMRGKTFKRAVVILDEAQNATKNQMKLFLTRIGEDCTVIVDGDITQTDISNSGLADAIQRLAFIPSVSIVKFDFNDIVRSSLAQEIVQAYSVDI